VTKENRTSERGPESYGQVVQRLEELVKLLEAGELSLEDSLKAFEEGIGLVRRGENLLSSAEKRIEQLLDDDGEAKVVPLDLAPTGPSPAPPANPSNPQRSVPPDPSDRGDVPF
jgi:exodeoxyribonuclease VII small subunit